jgi:hypothetical protein
MVIFSSVTLDKVIKQQLTFGFVTSYLTTSEANDDIRSKNR